MTEPSWSVRLARPADKDMDRLDPQVRQRIVTSLERLASDDPRSDVRKLKGTDELRLRVGEWRVRFSRDEGRREILVLRVLPRGRAYRN